MSASYTTQPFNKLTATTNSSFGYDNNGNMTQKTDSSGTWVYEWDIENRLKKATKPNGDYVVYKYDALGRRIERIPSVGISTKFTHDGQDVILDQNSDATTIKYLNGLGIDNKLRQMTGSGTVSYFLSDHLGSTNALTNSLGVVISQTNYDGFGNQTATLSTRYGYTGRERDDLTGLIYYRARQYSAELGRFISEDPIGFAGGDVNLYGYVGNNSLNFSDPSGLERYGSNFYREGYEAWRKTHDRINDEYARKSQERLRLSYDPNYFQCGPGPFDNIGEGNLVPQSFTGPYGGKFTFKDPACFNHDSCFPKEGAVFEQCNSNFLADMYNTCDTTPDVCGADRTYCKLVAGYGYYPAVTSPLGRSAYEAAQRYHGHTPIPAFTPDPCSVYGNWRCK